MLDALTGAAAPRMMVLGTTMLAARPAAQAAAIAMSTGQNHLIFRPPHRVKKSRSMIEPWGAALLFQAEMELSLTSLVPAELVCLLWYQVMAHARRMAQI